MICAGQRVVVEIGARLLVDFSIASNADYLLVGARANFIADDRYAHLIPGGVRLISRVAVLDRRCTLDDVFFDGDLGFRRFEAHVK